jgi:hypothetical protein
LLKVIEPVAVFDEMRDEIKYLRTTLLLFTFESESPIPGLSLSVEVSTVS